MTSSSSSSLLAFLLIVAVVITTGSTDALRSKTALVTVDGDGVSTTAAPPNWINPFDQLYVRIVGNLADGLLGGFLEEQRGNYTVFGFGLAGCIQNGVNVSDVVLEFDQTMSLFYNPINGSANAVKGIESLSGNILPLLAQVLRSCNASSKAIAAVVTAAPLLTDVEAMNGTLQELMINEAEVYNDLATAVAYWDRADYHESGLFIGTMLRKVATQSNVTELLCFSQGDFWDATRHGSQVLWSSFTTQLGQIVGIGEDEEVILPLNFPEYWDWCYNYTSKGPVYVCKPREGIFGYDQFLDLNLYLKYDDPVDFEPYFDQHYQYWLNTLNTTGFNTEQYRLLDYALGNTSLHTATYIMGSVSSYNASLWNTSTTAEAWLQENSGAKFNFARTGELNYRSYCSGNPDDLIPQAMSFFKNQNFIQVNKNGTWYDIEVDYYNENNSINIEATGLSRVNVAPGGWYSPEAVWEFSNIGNDNFWDGQGIVSGIIVASNVVGSITMDSDEWSAIEQIFGPPEYETLNSTGIRIGPIFVQGYQAEWGHTGFSGSMGFNHTMDMPSILGYIIRKLPYNPNP